MEADISLTNMAMDIGSGQFNRYKEDNRLFVHFFLSPVPDPVKTSEEGRPMFRDEQFIKIVVPGDKGNVIVRPASKMDKDRFSRQYHAFLNNQEQSLTGTPLENWPGVTRAQVEELKYFEVRTVEQLADMPDVHAQKFMGVNLLRQRARDYIAAAKEAAPMAALRTELEERDNKIEALQKAMEEMREMLAAKETEED